MIEQTIIIGGTGRVKTLQLPPDRGLDLRVMGRVTSRRASEIVFDEETQCWRIEALPPGKQATPIRKDTVDRFDLWTELVRFGGRWHNRHLVGVEPDVVFPDYGNAVEFERILLPRLWEADGYDAA